MTSFEVGMMFTIIIKVVMSAFGMWYISFNGYIEPSLNEEILLTHLCVKWQINTNLPKLEKLSKILETLTDALNAKKNFDREIEELVLKEEKDINEYKQLMQSENWKNMQTLVSEVLSFDSRICYMKIKEEIAFLQEQHSKDTARVEENKKTEAASEESCDSQWTVQEIEEEKKEPEPRRETQRQLLLPQEQVQKLRLQLPPFRPPPPQMPPEEIKHYNPDFPRAAPVKNGLSKKQKKRIRENR